MIFSTSIPKSGTHLLAQVLADLYGSYPVSVKEKPQNATFSYERYEKIPHLLGHFRDVNLELNPSLKSLFINRKVFILLRDPRDICSSMVHYLEKSGNPNHVQASKELIGLTLSEKIKKVAFGFSTKDKKFRVARLTEHCSGFEEVKIIIPEACILKYEDFFFDNLAAKRISNFLEINEIDVKTAIDSALASDGKTKRAGVPYPWKTNFDEDLKRFFDFHFNEIIEKLGYEVGME